MALIGRFIRLTLLLVLVAISMTSAGFAEKQHLEAVGTYVLGDRDTRDVAERRAVKDAIRVATQMAGVYVESYSKVHNLVLTKDEVTTIALSIIRVYDQDISFIVLSPSFEFCKLTKEPADELFEKYKTSRDGTWRCWFRTPYHYRKELAAGRAFHN